MWLFQGVPSICFAHHFFEHSNHNGIKIFTKCQLMSRKFYKTFSKILQNTLSFWCWKLRNMGYVRNPSCIFFDFIFLKNWHEIVCLMVKKYLWLQNSFNFIVQTDFFAWCVPLTAQSDFWNYTPYFQHGELIHAICRIDLAYHVCHDS